MPCVNYYRINMSFYPKLVSYAVIYWGGIIRREWGIVIMKKHVANGRATEFTPIKIG